MANIKYIGNDSLKSERGKIHVKKGNYTTVVLELTTIHKTLKVQLISLLVKKERGK